MRILSLDQAIRCTGYAVHEGTDLIKQGSINLQKEKDTELRLRKMCTKIKDLIDEYKPDIVVFEDVSLRQSIKTLIALSRLQGAIIQTTYSYGTDYCIYPPTQWRSILGFNQGKDVKRPQLKDQAIARVAAQYHLDVKDNDAAEGICIGLAYIIEHNVKGA